MSSIYGVYVNTCKEVQQCLQNLKYWNQSYGSNDGSCMGNERWAVGSCMEHLSDYYPAGMPILMHDEYVAVIDAVIYNRGEIAAVLNIAAVQQISDEELLFHYIMEKGFSALNIVNGDFAGAVFNKETCTWTVFRDHMGIRPLFYYKDDEYFLFSTDIRGITSYPDIDTGVNEEKLYLTMMGYNDLSLCETEFKNIYCVPPASWVEVKVTGQGFRWEPHVYWKLGSQKIRYGSDEEYQKKMYELVSDSVQKRLDAVSGTIGGELSGGLDSGVIALLIGRSGREAVFFSWSRDLREVPLKEGEDERKIILDICRQEGFSCQFSSAETREKMVTSSEAIEMEWPPYINTTKLMEGASYLKTQGARVVFTGHGGDEGVSHRCNLYELWGHHEYLAFIRCIYRQTEGRKLRLLRTLKAIIRQLMVVHPQFRSSYHVNENSGICLNKDFRERCDKQIDKKNLTFAYNPIEYIMQGGSRDRIDNAAFQGAQAGVRYMFPFLDYRVIDFAVSIPRAQYHNGYINRWIYREAFKDLMPESLKEVRYKDTPSRGGGGTLSPEKRIEKKNRAIASIQKIAGKLDREKWAPYLDLDAINNITYSDSFTTEEDWNAAQIINDLTWCVLIQNALKSTDMR